VPSSPSRTGSPHLPRPVLSLLFSSQPILYWCDSHLLAFPFHADFSIVAAVFPVLPCLFIALRVDSVVVSLGAFRSLEPSLTRFANILLSSLMYSALSTAGDRMPSVARIPMASSPPPSPPSTSHTQHATIGSNPPAIPLRIYLQRVIAGTCTMEEVLAATLADARRRG
jgi:hypothetical protein